MGRTVLALDSPIRCTAKSKTSGERCGQAVVHGATVCRWHGGKAPQVMAKAEERLKAMVPAALEALNQIITGAESEAVKLAAVRDLLDRTGYGATKNVNVNLEGDLTLRAQAIVEELRQQELPEHED